MKDSAYKCAVCGGLVQYNPELDHYKCNECLAIHESVLYKNADAKMNRGKFRLKWSLFGAIIAALYLLWLVYRLFVY